MGSPKVEEYPEVPNFKDLSAKYPKFHGQGIKIDGVPKEANDFLEKILCVNPSKRFSVD
jgi:hypothetical protein